MNLRDFSQHWRSTVLVTKEQATIDTMSSHLRRLNEELGDDEIGALTNTRIQQVFTGLSSRYGARTIRNHWSTLHMVLSQAQREGIIERIPDRPQLSRVRRSPQPWYTPDEMRKLVGAAPSPLRELAGLLAETGLRIGEALGLATSGVDRERKLLSVRQKVYRGKPGVPKTDTSFRDISLSTPLAELLGGRLGVGDDYVFRTRGGTPLWPNFAASKMAHVCSEVGLEWKGFHAFRRGNKTLMRELGVPASLRMYRQGHSAKEGGIGAIYDQTEGLTSREREEERLWAERLGAVVISGKDIEGGSSPSAIESELVAVLQQLQMPRSEAQRRARSTVASHPELTTVALALPVALQG